MVKASIKSQNLKLLSNFYVVDLSAMNTLAGIHVVVDGHAFNTMVCLHKKGIKW